MPHLAQLLVSACILLGLATGSLHAQYEHVCGTDIGAPIPDDGDQRGMDCSRTSDAYLQKYRTPGHWAPLTNITPPKTIKLNFVICRDGNGLNGWENTPNMMNEFNNLVQNISTMYTATGWRNYPSTCPL